MMVSFILFWMLRMWCSLLRSPGVFPAIWMPPGVGRALRYTPVADWTHAQAQSLVQSLFTAKKQQMWPFAFRTGPQKTYSQTQEHVLAHADLNVQAEQGVHAAQLQLVHQLSVQLVLHERQQVGDCRGVHFALGLLFQTTQPEGKSKDGPVISASGSSVPYLTSAVILHVPERNVLIRCDLANV